MNEWLEERERERESLARNNTPPPTGEGHVIGHAHRKNCRCFPVCKIRVPYGLASPRAVMLEVCSFLPIFSVLELVAFVLLR